MYNFIVVNKKRLLVGFVFQDLQEKKTWETLIGYMNSA